MVLGIIDIETNVEYVLFHRRLRFSSGQVVASTFKVCIYDDSPRSWWRGGVYIFYTRLAFLPFNSWKTMKSKPILDLADIKAIAAAAEAEALKNNWAVTIAIVDDGGHLLHLQRLDGAAPISAHIAPAKANTAAMGRRESKVYEDVINGGRTSFLSAPYIQGMLEGGVPIVKDCQCLR